MANKVQRRKRKYTTFERRKNSFKATTTQKGGYPQEWIAFEALLSTKHQAPTSKAS